MALILKNFVRMHFYFNDECSDPRVREWPLMSNPFPTLAIMGLYLMFVNKWGPQFMKDRKPMNLEKIMQVYNLIQVILCGFIVVESFRLVFFVEFNWMCQDVDFSTSPTAMAITRRAYLYFGLKLIDLLDTVFFVLRKKDNQITFLHVYHHAGMVALVWTATKYFPGGHGIFMGALNSFVHVVMYGYYFLTSYNPEFRKNVWWKKHITQLQLVQFFLIILHFTALLFGDCQYPKSAAGLLIPQNLFMFVLFGDFYYKAYVKEKPAKKLEIDGKDSKKLDEETVKPTKSE